MNFPPNPGRRFFNPILLPLIACLLMPVSLNGHPDLLVQIETLDSRILEEQRKEEPDDAGLLLKRADLYRRHGDYEAALRDIEAARRSDPALDDPGPDTLEFIEGRILLDSGRPEAALRSFNRYLADNPEQPKALKLRAEASLALGRWEDAAADFSRAIDHAPKPSPALYRQYALALAAAGEERWPEARAVIDRGLSHFPLEVSLLGLGADIALAQDQPAAARAYIAILPPALRELPQWQARDGLARAMASGDPEERRQNLITARESLAAQLEALRPVP